MKRIELTEDWPEQIKKHLKVQIENVNPASGWWWDDCRFDYEYGSIRGVAGEVMQDYDSARHDEVEPILIPLKSLPIVYPYDEVEEPIKTEQELMAYIQSVIIDEFPAIDCGEWPAVKLVAEYSIISKYGAKIHSAPVSHLKINFDFKFDIYKR